LATERFENLIEEIRKPIKVEYRHVIDIGSSKVFFSMVVIAATILGMAYVIGNQKETISQYKDNDLKYRYIKMQGQALVEDVYRSEKFTNQYKNRKVKMKKEKAIELIQKQIDLIESVKRFERFSQEYTKWKRDTEIIIEKIFGDKTRHLTDFKNISYSFSIFSNFTPDYEFQEKFVQGMDTAKTILTSMKEEIIEFAETNEYETIDENPLIKVEKICNRFHLIARQIRERHDNRDTINIEDEYDVQDLLHAILKLEFDDIRPEEWTPSYAGKSSRVDFLLKKEEIIIEVKKTRKGLTGKEVGDQLLIDIQRYQQHPNCKYLICFIYDPEGRIPNPSGIEKDLTTENRIKIITIITPKGL
jgi:hypothetical protein